MKEKWFSLDIGDIEKKLNTNAASGLSPKAARSRRRRTGAPFFTVPRKSAISGLGEILSDLCLVLLIISSVVAVCFDERITGLTLLCIIAINLFACALIYIRAERFFESMAAFFRPTTTVIRGGKAYALSSEGIVEGDVVLLSAGDVLSFDARLVSSDSLRVMVRYDREHECECEKRAEGVVKENENDIRNICNMVHASSKIISGGARAIVVATGRYTYYGALTGGVVLQADNAMPRGLRLLKKFCQGMSLALTVAVLPFSFVALLLGPEKVTLLTAFTSVLAVAASSLSQISCTACRIFFEHKARAALTTNSPVAVRSADTMDRLMTVDYAFLLDGASTSDGVLHFCSAISADEVADPEAVSRDFSFLGELASLYQSAEKGALTLGVSAPGRYNTGLSEFIQKCGTDTEALKIRCAINGYVTGDSHHRTDKLFFVDRNVRFVLGVSRTRDIIDGCDRCFSGGGISPLGTKKKSELAEHYDRMISEGKIPLVFTLSDMTCASLEGKAVSVGMVVLSQRIDDGFPRAIARLEAMGIRTVSFVGDENREGEVLSPILDKAVSRSELLAVGYPLTHKFGEFNTYRGFTAQDIDVLIKHLHSKGKRVAVVGFSEFCRQISETPDVFVTCSPLDYKFVGRMEQQLKTLEVASSPEGSSVRQDIKEAADVIIPRPEERHGGLLSLVRAFEMAGSAYHNLVGFFRYVLATQFIRICMILLPMLAGYTYLDARHALFCGFIVDVAVMLIFARDRRGVDGAREFKTLSRELLTPVRNNLGIIVSGAAGSLCALILPNVLGGVDAFGRYLFQSEYLFVSMLLLHITTMYCVRAGSFVVRGRVHINKLAINFVAATLLFVAFCFVITPLGALFDIVDITLPYLLLTPAPSLVCAMIYFFIGNIRLRQDI